MFQRLSIKQRMYAIIAFIFFLFLLMVWFAFRIAVQVEDKAVVLTENVMLEAQKQKVKTAVYTLATAFGHALEDLDEKEQKIELLRRLVDDVLFEEDQSGYYFVYEGTVNVALPVNKKLQGQDLKNVKDKNGVAMVHELFSAAEKGGGFVEYVWPKPGLGDVPKISYAQKIPGTRFWIGTGVYLDNIDAYAKQMTETLNEDVQSLITNMMSISGVIFLGIVAFCLVIVFGISASLRSMIVSFQDIAQGKGDLTKTVDIKSRDELGEISGLFNLFLEKLKGIIKELSKESQDVDNASNAFLAISGEMSAGSVSMTGKTKEALIAAQTMNHALSDVVAAMDASSGNANMVAAAAEEMNVTISEIAKNAEEARRVSETAAANTKKASQEMAGLDEAADSVGKVVATITEISEQVNLLALNATIEAARAGEAGKGFNVVANEIKDLAGQTSAATEDIRSEIENIQAVANSAGSSIKGVGETIINTQDIVSSIASAIGEQSSATREISSNIEELSSMIQQVNQNVGKSFEVASTITDEIGDVSDSFAQISSNSDEVKKRAEELKEMSEELNGIVATFVVD